MLRCAASFSHCGKEVAAMWNERSKQLIKRKKVFPMKGRIRLLRRTSAD
jgi:hypothetical protein